MTQKKVSGGNTLGFTWNTDNLPATITKNGTGFVSYTYDGNGQRVRKQNLQSGNMVLYFGEAYEIRGAVGIMHLFTDKTRVVSIRSDGREQYYHANHLRSASVIADFTTGDRKERLEFYPFGGYRERVDYDAAFPNANYTFTDQEDDDETGLYNFKARLYDPLLGRFISADTVVPDPGNLQSLNRHSYCQNNPIRFVDPTGHFLFPWHLGIEFTASLASGQGFFKSLRNAFENMMVDNFRNQGSGANDANKHFMAGYVGTIPQSPEQAIQGAQNYINTASLPQGNHTIQDSRSGVHNGNSMADYGLSHPINTTWHFLRDTVPWPGEVIGAWQDTYTRYQEADRASISTSNSSGYNYSGSSYGSSTYDYGYSSPSGYDTYYSGGYDYGYSSGAGSGYDGGYDYGYCSDYGGGYDYSYGYDDYDWY